MKSLQSVAFLFAIIATGLFFVSNSSQTRKEVEEFAQPEKREPFQSMGNAGAVPSFLFRSSESLLGLYCEADYHELGLDFVIHEKAPYSGDFYSHSIGVSTPFGIEAVSARHFNEVYVAGVFPNGDFTIQRWGLRPQDGALFTKYPATVSGLGTPAGSSWPEVHIKGEVGFIPPPDRVGPIQPTKEVLYNGSDFVGVKNGGLAVDPNGKFLVFHEAGTGALVQLDLSTGSFSTISSPSTHPMLLEEWSTMDPYIQEDDAQGGRYIMIHPPADSTSQHVFFVDAENDGIFESTELLTEDEWLGTNGFDYERFFQFNTFASPAF